MMKRCGVWGLVLLQLLVAASALAQSQGEAAVSQPPAGALQMLDVPAPSLAGSRLWTPPAERAAVYLPPSYGSDAERRYPVVYYLTGFMDQLILYTHVPFYQGFLLQEAMDRLIGERAIGEMIVVIPNGLTPLGGSFYVNSPANGDWKDFIVRDLVGYIDANFRTIATPAGRAIAGHSMGGFGALNIAMRHPDVFAAIYALSPGLAAPGGLETQPSFASPIARQRVCDLLKALDDAEGCERERVLLAQASYWNQIFNTSPLFNLAYSAAFAAESEGSSFRLEFPYYREGEDFARDPRIWARFEAGFGMWEEKIQQHQASLKRLAFITIDVGENDEYQWIPAGSHFVAAQLSAAGIHNELVTHSGAHDDRLRERLETAMFPALSRFFAHRR